MFLQAATESKVFLKSGVHQIATHSLPTRQSARKGCLFPANRKKIASLDALPQRIEDTFARLRARSEKGFIAYIGAGDPSLETTRALALTLEKCGVDLLELGIPFSDPLADGIVNQMSA